MRTEKTLHSSPPDYLLNKWAADVFSQTGEDGITEQILSVIGERNGWAVEFGGWDGLRFSNCANLFRHKNYSGVFVEVNQAKYKELLCNYANYPKVKAFNQLVGFEAKDNLDALLADVSIPPNLDFLSIDIDGNDYYVWKAIRTLRPKLVCIEFNPTIPSEVDFAQEANPKVQQGSSLAAMIRLGKEKGYELVCATEWNGFFVDGKYFDRFKIPDNSIQNLRRNLSAVTYIFSGYDGRMILAGNKKMLWHDLPMEEERMQQLPRSLIDFPDDYSPLQKLIFRRLRRWRLNHFKTR